VTVTVINNSGPGKVTVTATITGSNASQSGSTSMFFDQGQQQDVAVIITNARTNETLTINTK
jgi:ABC-type nitrate/sulfonate/bicarbonate transport system ATPase subunit